MSIRDFFKVLTAIPAVIGRRRARGGFTHEAWQNGFALVELLLFPHGVFGAAIWYAKGHQEDPMRWFGAVVVSCALVWIWAYLLQHAYRALERAAQRLEIK
ncbi:hypothetical protein PP715_21345 [Ralstonia solanacearum]|uniref:Uncharacterized protein n=2 Tax=Ralstonia solanacearum TaxID=305 RepID=A0A5H2Q0Q5_RALSL|nr:hypothetical protein [Ralstonia solanacearum]AEG68821.1 hypothetical protein RSPO_c01521 [Ralstonia solanacearum Po82]AMP70039.1 hypothetical protein UW163_11440 [Ralstonia solanacearum]AYB60428.1 hypothetical protein C2124_07380 [Ralstonia solanacearum]MBB6587257.1 hypothetical protein [Ralstonia solanacearum]MCG3577350.1 hypothetical protein [Ralstonia solanacearum]